MTNKRNEFFIIVGSPRASTSYLKDILEQSKEVNIPRGETLFWSYPYNFKSIKFHLKSFLKNINKNKESIIGIKNPSIARLERRKLRHIQLSYNNPKIIYLLRDNKQRIISDLILLFKDRTLKFKAAMLLGKARGTFNRVIEDSDYERNIKNLHAVFGDKLKIIFFEEFIKNDLEIVNKIAEFLNIKSFSNFKKKKKNSMSNSYFLKNYFKFLLPKIYTKEKMEKINSYLLIKNNILKNYKSHIISTHE